MRQKQDQADIILCTVNARYSHASLALRYLYANLGELQQRCVIREFVDQQAPADVAESLLKLSPRIIGLSIYIWNSAFMLQVLRILKAVAPKIIVVVGGPEVSFANTASFAMAGSDANNDVGPSTADLLATLADHVVRGEGELLFAPLCHDLLAGRASQKIIGPMTAQLNKNKLAYSFYDDEDIAHRTTYVESSRGCPYGCEFCLSSLDERVRYFALKPFLHELDTLFKRGARHFKFVDRTFNLKPGRCVEILDFFYARYVSGLFLHFEVVPFYLHDDVIRALAQFPSGALQLEIGIQSLDESVNRRIGRRQNSAQALATIARLRAETRAHLHVDLVAGLPGESIAALGQHFNRLRQSGAHEIQLGILKKLAGAPIARHDHTWQMRYRHTAPYDLLANRDISFMQMQALKRFSYLWDRIGNSGRFINSLNLLFADEVSEFGAFDKLTRWLHAREGRVHAISLSNLARALASYLIEIKQIDEDTVRTRLRQDFARAGKKAPPIGRAAKAQKTAKTKTNKTGQRRQNDWRQQKTL